MIRLRDAGKRFGDRWVLRGVSLTVERGSMLLVAGANGTGKSTLLRVMAGLVRPDEGAVGRDAPAGGIGYVGHAPLVYPGLTALENLAFWSSLHRRRHDEKTLLDALAAVELEAFADEMAGTFSRGMAQRLSLARLFLLRPSLALLDEPLAGLDAPFAARMREAFTRLKAEGAAVVRASHEPPDAAADAVLLLDSAGGHRLLAPEAFRVRTGIEPPQGARGGGS